MKSSPPDRIKQFYEKKKEAEERLRVGQGIVLSGSQHEQTLSKKDVLRIGGDGKEPRSGRFILQKYPREMLFQSPQGDIPEELEEDPFNVSRHKGFPKKQALVSKHSLKKDSLTRREPGGSVSSRKTPGRLVQELPVTSGGRYYPDLKGGEPVSNLTAGPGLSASQSTEVRNEEYWNAVRC